MLPYYRGHRSGTAAVKQNAIKYSHLYTIETNGKLGLKDLDE